MARIQIRLDEHDYALARKQATRLGVSLAQFMRRAINKVLAADGNRS
jgi:hypothetical protein